MSTAVAVPERVALFCQYLLAGSDPPDAAKLAGYKNPRTTSRALLSHPQVRRALREGAEGFLLADLTPIALRIMRDILTDTNPRAVAVRAKLAVAVYDRATRASDAADPAAARLAQLTTEQLAELVARGAAAEAQERATIDVTPRETPAR